MALTQQEILETRKRLGIPEGGVSAPPVSSAAQNVARRRQLAAEYDAKQAEKKPGFISRVGEDLKKRAGSIKETISEGMKGESNPLRSGVRIAGQIAGGIGDVVAEGAVSGFRALPDAVEQPIRKAGTKILQTKVGQAGLEAIEQGVEAYEAFKTKYPEIAEDLEAVVNIASLLPAWKGAQVSKNVAKTAGKGVVEAAETVAAKSAKIIDDVAKPATKVAKDIIPTRKEMISGQITKALDLTQGDVSNIKLSTKNDVGDWISNKNLIGGNKKETLGKVKELTDTQYKAVREEIAKVPTVYKSATVPRVRESLSMLSDDLKGVLGQEKAVSEANALLKKKTYKLEDVQRVKELLDDQFDLYKATGDVKAGQTKAGLANVRTELKNFIEKEVKDNTGADIRGMNNDVSTGKSIQKLAEKRSTRDFTRANVSLSDLGVFGTGSILATPLGGAAAFVVKRILETPTVRLKFAKFLSSLPKKEVEIIKNTLLKGEVPKSLKDFNTGAVPKTVFEKAENLSSVDRQIETKAFDRITKDEAKILSDYSEKYGKVVNTDNFRPFFKDIGYEGHNAVSVQEPASYLGKKAFSEGLKNDGKYATLYAGGSGSGKTSALKDIDSIQKLLDDSSVVWDGNLSSIKSATSKIQEALKAGKKAPVVYVYREPVDSFVNGVVKRMLKNPDEMGRLVPSKVVAENHINSWKVAQQLSKEGNTVLAIDNSLGAGKSKLVPLSELQKKIKYPSIEELTSIFNKEAKKMYDSGQITKQQYEGYIK